MPLNDDLGRCAASPAPDDEKPTSPPASIIEVAMEAIANAPTSPSLPPLIEAKIKILGFDVLNTAEDKKAETRIRKAAQKAVQPLPPRPEEKRSGGTTNGRGLREQKAARRQ